MNTSAATTETKGLTRIGEVKILWECGSGLAHRVGRSDLATRDTNEKGGLVSSQNYHQILTDFLVGNSIDKVFNMMCYNMSQPSSQA